jgi:hypothetical protein
MSMYHMLYVLESIAMEFTNLGHSHYLASDATLYISHWMINKFLLLSNMRCSPVPLLEIATTLTSCLLELQRSGIPIVSFT